MTSAPPSMTNDGRSWRRPYFVIGTRQRRSHLSSGTRLYFLRPLVHRLAQRLARLEVRNALLRDVHALAGSRIASHAGRAAVDREAAEAADLDAVAAHQCVAHRVEDGLDGVLRVAMGQLAESGGQFFYEVATGHCCA